MSLFAVLLIALSLGVATLSSSHSAQSGRSMQPLSVAGGGPGIIVQPDYTGGGGPG